MYAKITKIHDIEVIIFFTSTYELLHVSKQLLFLHSWHKKFSHQPYPRRQRV